ncbi:MAG: SlyX family protein [Verrucomicrobiales bacterium]|nr:SlyX family protein [Verrucomicrobiales bacterium]
MIVQHPPGADAGGMVSAESERLQRLEIQLTHLERQYEVLNSVVMEQGKQITRLQALAFKLTESVEQAEADRIRSTPSRPPHSAPPL